VSSLRIFLAALPLVFPTNTRAADTPRPNFVLILADDLGSGHVGWQPQHDLNWDGRDILPLLTGGTAPTASRTFYSKGPGKASAICADPWKLVVTGTREELFNLASDRGEETDLAAEHPDLVRQLRATLEAQAAKDNDAVPQRTGSP
jgi:arylsulfatase A-like enzyme